jgi:hypothetical protein
MVINGPPERTRTRSPVRNGGRTALCIAVFTGGDSEKAGIDKGILSAIPSVTAIAIETCFVNADILNSMLNFAAASIRAHHPNMLPNGQSESGYQLFVKGLATPRGANQGRLDIHGSRKAINEIEFELVG